jgi:hypothetical protein
VPFVVPREQLTKATGVRSTLIASSVKSVRARGLFDRYLEGLDAQWRDTILQTVAGIWLPLGAGVAHYRACDALGLSAAEQYAIGREVGDRVHGTFLSAMVRAAKSVGVTPWNALAYTGKLYERLFEGGGMCVERLGPKEARCEMANNAIAGIPYFRNGFRGLYAAGVELFCTKAYVQDVAKQSTPTSCVMRISWA